MVLNVCNTSIIDRYIKARCIFRDWYGVNERYAYFIYVVKLALMKPRSLLERMAQEHCNFLLLDRANLHFLMPLKLNPLQNHHATASFCGQAQWLRNVMQAEPETIFKSSHFMLPFPSFFFFNLWHFQHLKGIIFPKAWYTCQTSREHSPSYVTWVLVDSKAWLGPEYIAKGSTNLCQKVMLPWLSEWKSRSAGLKASSRIA